MYAMLNPQIKGLKTDRQSPRKAAMASIRSRAATITATMVRTRME